MSFTEDEDSTESQGCMHNSDMKCRDGFRFRLKMCTCFSHKSALHSRLFGSVVTHICTQEVTDKQSI
eukprot:6393930-Ditylum_brightwellii.AAC.1